MRRVKAILVHGTFANETDWDDPDAPFSTRLKEKLAEKGAELETEEFRWSGENSHEARRVAAEALAEKLRVEGRNGYDDVFLVGHSHGGTVTRLALNKLDAEDRPTGVFSLGAPFVRFKPKKIELVATVITVLLRALALIGVAMLTRIFFVQDWIKAAIGDPMMMSGATALVGLFLFWFLVVFCPGRLRGWAVGKLMGTQKEIVAAYDPPAKQVTPFVCFHALGDEAGILLRFWSLVTWILQTGMFIMVYGAILLLIIAVPMLAYQAASDFGLIEPATTQSLFTWFVEKMRAVADLVGMRINDPAEVSAETAALAVPSAAAFSSLAIFGTLVAMALISTPVTLLAPWLLRRQWFAFGGENLAWNLAADIQVDRCANERSAMRYVFIPQSYLKGSMQHNFYYHSQGVVDDIARRMCAWNPPSARLSFDFERAIGRAITLALLAIVLAASVPFTWIFAELNAELPESRRQDPKSAIEAPATGD